MAGPLSHKVDFPSNIETTHFRFFTETLRRCRRLTSRSSFGDRYRSSCWRPWLQRVSTIVTPTTAVHPTTYFRVHQFSWWHL